VLASGVLYTVGRSLVYVGLGAALVFSLMSAPAVSQLLQKCMNLRLGPLLIIVGMILLELVRITPRGSGVGEKVSRRVESWGLWGALLLGVVFALSFCPVSAALFFGSLVPLAVKHQSAVMLPSLYGAGTALPVFAFAILIVISAQAVGRAFNRITQFEKWARRVTGVVFIGVGVYMALEHIFEVV
jgi:cytochrome c biogenesis protein CcdA